ncbi:transketolase [Candidatus Woesebacteria bacterium RIFCSPLOWO2_01_FULL_39_61]|uniref:Transketolase n=1 Tax=Candidatus Woesebacteria bacterium RIFCSPHIGHO2_02_FULL_39_13 TaxID=1802505 RepID=A0A1F7Z3C5_9BACT|nr:MAG: transketolase [Candidatus Woesebacteria bacterium RIFCSPHIGHO2_01_FULL_39_95]OGM33910.1 MAG: transketolase [Candidatus Woesebacteria bacterium RIFCSPHIGHO2_02_FULL_39_13]OGM37199.1 MAG: transketolase [Candidatus Woesebacteria bacterium RIFCSPHIGHO2_12_FULL_40_20]OGM65884.1 MAG: transketolase [Candidatus Woesebacteria bacterium RIFCSPLOWO2_01_FULL_39_61]OGM74067.1 MAG: transketolase [Candidatus Woesebacteria bacterium RIFCSPLOWO2_12_FULL_39_9]
MQDLQNKANEIRQDIIKMLLEAGSGHSAGPLGMADVFTSLYFGEVMSYDPKNPKWEERDRLILSNGHICPVLYATLAHAGFFPHDELMTLRKLGSRLQGHPERERLPGIETTSGPLGSGLAQASGYAYAAHMDSKKFRVFCVTSDAEHQEGNHWEAVAFAGKYNLSNLTALVDRNNIQISGFIEDVMPVEPLKAKYEAFNWAVLEVDGHNIEAIIDAINMSKAIHENPTVIICRTIPGKGVEFMENLPEWHGTSPNSEEAKKALHELRTLGGKIRGEHE